METQWGIMMRDCTALCNKAGEHFATIGFNGAFGLWQIIVGLTIPYTDTFDLTGVLENAERELICSHAHLIGPSAGRGRAAYGPFPQCIGLQVG